MHLIRLGSSVTLALFASACATSPDTVVFVTKTSIGVDVEQQTPGVSVAYDRVEGYLAPRYSGDKIPAVYASFNSNGEVYNRDVRHVYATGRAAKAIAANQALLARLDKTNKVHNLASFPAVPESRPEIASKPGEKAQKTMFFGTSTTIGLKIATADLTGDTFTFGVKRKEMSVIPSNGDPDDFPSVIASPPTWKPSCLPLPRLARKKTSWTSGSSSRQGPPRKQLRTMASSIISST